MSTTVSEEQVLSPELLEFAHRYIRKIHIKWGKYKYTGGGKGYHKRSVFLSHLRMRMIEELVLAAVKDGATDLVRSMRTHSVYFKLGGVDYRISDHCSKEFQGEQVIISLSICR